jgi:hypothetical protein
VPTFLSMVALVNGDCWESLQTVSPQGDRKGRPYIYNGLPEADNIFHMLQRRCCNWAHVVGSLFEDGIQRWQIAH